MESIPDPFAIYCLVTRERPQSITEDMSATSHKALATYDEGDLRPGRTLSRQSRENTHKKSTKDNDPAIENDPRDWPTTQTTENKAWTDLTGKNDPENPRPSTLTTPDSGWKSRGTTDAIFKQWGEVFPFSQTQPTKPQKHNGVTQTRRPNPQGNPNQPNRRGWWRKERNLGTGHWRCQAQVWCRAAITGDTTVAPNE